MEEKIRCRTPAEGRNGVSNIPKWKFDAVRAAVLDVLKEGDIPFSKLKDAVIAKMSAEDLANLGSPGWHVTCVKLELEVRGEVARAPGKGPQLVTPGNLGLS